MNFWFLPASKRIIERFDECIFGSETLGTLSGIEQILCLAL